MNYPKRRPNTSPEAIARRRAMIDGLPKQDQIEVIVEYMRRHQRPGQMQARASCLYGIDRRRKYQA